MIRSLRGFPYTLETALADIIDNSITAGATEVRIFADANRGYPRLAVIDDGSGMSEPELRQAMRLGSKDPAAEREQGDLGRFGLGLKTASFSQCRRLTVVTSRDWEQRVARWDLAHVYATDEWEVQVPTDLQALPWTDELGEHGTVVLWEDLDRVIDSDSLDEIAAEFNRRVSSAATHLELVFHRFMEGEAGLPKISISLNGQRLKPMNPFNPSHRATITDPSEVIGVAGSSVTAKAYTLPHFSKVAPADWEKYALERGYIREQGFYLYRAGRLIVHGTWFGLAKQTELTKLTRVRIDIPNGMDHLWKIDVLKASAHPPHVVRQRLRTIVERLGATSKRVYVNRGKRLTAKENFPIWERRAVHEGIRYAIDPTHPAIEDLRTDLDEASDAKLRNILQLLGASLPIDSLIVDLGDSPHRVSGEEATGTAVESLAEAMITALRDTASSWPDIERTLRGNTLIAANWERVSALINEHKISDPEA